VGRRSGATEPAGGRRPSWGVQTSLFQTREPAFWLYLLLLLVAGALTLRQQRDLEAASPSAWALSWALLTLYLLPIVAVIYLLDLYEREPPSLVAGALLYGGVCASALAALANDGWSAALARLTGPDFAARWSAALTAPWTEELVKGCGVVLLYLIASAEFDDIMDGFVYGAMVGLGFSVVEDAVYFVLPGGHASDVLGGFFVRVVASGLYGHVLYSGLVGIAVAWVVTRRGEQPRFRRLAAAGALAAVAVAAHFLWNSPWLDLFPSGDPVGPRALVQVVVAAAVKGLPFLAVLMVMLTLARRRESHWLRHAVAAEVGGPGLLAGELEVLSDPRRRRLARRRLRRGHGREAAAILRRLHRAQINLAMIRTRVGDDHHPDLVGQRERCRALRERLPGIAAE
jgi:protease PrsW